MMNDVSVPMSVRPERFSLCLSGVERLHREKDLVVSRKRVNHNGPENARLDVWRGVGTVWWGTTVASYSQNHLCISHDVSVAAQIAPLYTHMVTASCSSCLLENSIQVSGIGGELERYRFCTEDFIRRRNTVRVSAVSM